jgi:4-hydroxy-tetrahydrodipicolinate synthase
VSTSNKRFGLSCAIISPIDATGAPDLARLVAHGKDLLARGCDSLTLFGTTGEGAQIGHDDRQAMLGAMLGAGIPAGQIYCAVAASAAEEAIREGRTALQQGVAGLLLTPPFYFKGVSDDALFGWYHKVLTGLGALARGIVLYHIPQVTQIPLSIDLVGRLKTAFPGVVIGVKDSSGSWENTEALLKAHGELAILVGDERQLARAVRLGGQGCICGVANLSPELIRPLVYEGKDDPRIPPLVNAILEHPVTPAVKALVAHLRGDGAYATAYLPLDTLPADRVAKLVADYKAVMG